MFHLSTTELIVILVIVVLVFGVGRIGKLAKELGGSIRAFREEIQSDDEKKNNEEPVNREDR